MLEPGLVPIETQSSESWSQQSTEMYCQWKGEQSGGLEEGSEKSKGPSKQILGSERLIGVGGTVGLN